MDSKKLFLIFMKYHPIRNFKFLTLEFEIKKSGFHLLFENCFIKNKF